MRRLLPFLFALLLVPSAASAPAGRGATGDGSLVVTGASARMIVVQGSGLIFGHVSQGTLTVVDYRAADPSSAQVSGSMVKVPVGSGTQYSGTDIRFLFPNGRYSLRIEGVGIDISAVGRGVVNAIGLGSGADGSLSTNSGRTAQIGSSPTTLGFGMNKGPNAASFGNGKGSPASSGNGKGSDH
jgi:hypothetical protein